MTGGLGKGTTWGANGLLSEHIDTSTFFTFDPSGNTWITVCMGFWTWAFAEDGSRVRRDHSPPNLAMLRHLALNLLHQKRPIKAA